MKINLQLKKKEEKFSISQNTALLQRACIVFFMAVGGVWFFWVGSSNE